MKKTITLLIFPLVLLAAILLAGPKHILLPVSETPVFSMERTPETPETVASAIKNNSAAAVEGTEENGGSSNKADDIVTYAMSLLGSPYIYAGISPDGFDCSGFITHVFSNFEMDVPHSSAMQAEEGIYVAREEAQVGDLVIFTGTNANVREPGHVGIVISSPGDTIEFVHSSSNGGVKVSQVEGTGYERRFLQIRRIL
jgi:cell wall-associated NlpC family hydrolase